MKLMSSCGVFASTTLATRPALRLLETTLVVSMAPKVEKELEDFTLLVSAMIAASHPSKNLLDTLAGVTSGAHSSIRTIEM